MRTATQRGANMVAIGALVLLGVGCTTKPAQLTLRNEQAQPLRVAFRVKGQQPKVVTVGPGAVVPISDAYRMTDLAELRWGDASGMDSFHDFRSAAQLSSCTSNCVVTFGNHRVRFTS